MSFALVEYGLLKQGIFQSIESCIEGHTGEKMVPGERTVDSLREALVSVDESHIDRKIQIEVLLTVVSILDGMVETHPLFSRKKEILNGAAYYTCYQIDKSYNAGLVGYLNAAVTSPKESVLRTSLHNALGITREVTPGDAEVSVMFTAFNELLMHNIFIDGDAKKGCLEESKQNFRPIENFSIMDTINNLSHKIEKVDRHLRRAAGKVLDDSTRPVPSESSWRGFGLWGSKKKYSKDNTPSQKVVTPSGDAKDEDQQLERKSSLT
jgi:hypothetical protein